MKTKEKIGENDLNIIENKEQNYIDMCKKAYNNALKKEMNKLDFKHKAEEWKLKEEIKELKTRNALYLSMSIVATMVLIAVAF